MCRLSISPNALLLFSIYSLSFTSFASVSMIAPLFPAEAAKKGVSTSVSGAIFSAYAFTLFLMTSVVGKILPLFGCKVVLSFGASLLGVCAIIFGLLEYVEEYYSFVSLCFIVRIFEAIGCACMMTTYNTVFAIKFRESLSKVVAKNETITSIGFTVGPPIASVLNKAGGYKLPFIVLGCAVLLNVPIILKYVENYEDQKNIESNNQNSDEERRVKLSKLLSMPGIIIASIALLQTDFNGGNNNATLEEFLRKSYDVSPANVGYIMGLNAGVYMISSLIISRFVSSLNIFVCFVVGLLLNSIAYIFMCPKPFYEFDSSLVVVIISYVLYGASSSFGIVLSMPSMMSTIEKYGYTNNVTNSSYVSAFWGTVFSLGMTIGPWAGGAILDNFGPQNLYFSLAAMNLISVIITALLCFHVSGRHSSAQREGYEELNGNADME